MLQTKEIEYKSDNTLFRGFVAYDDASAKPKPCVLIAHDWSGRGEAFCNKAKELAQMGYVGFALDMYGDAKLGFTTEERRALLTPIMSDRKTVVARMLAAYQTAKGLPEVNSHKMAAMGYCFGGLCVLDLARSGADLKGVVSFHGLLAAPEQTVCEKIRAKVLVLHGYDDPMVKPAAVNQFAHEMTMKKVDWQIHMYGLTQHSFTNPEANDDTLGLHYNAKADKRSWESTVLFLKEIFA
jgi:dienelactone hydrolase